MITIFILCTFVQNLTKTSMFYKKLFIVFFAFALTFGSSSCHRGSGCPGEKSGIKMGKNGELPTKRGKSKLFSKKKKRRSKWKR